MSRPNRRRRGRGQTIVVHNHNTAHAGAKARSDSCVVAMATILTAAATLVAVCVVFPGVIPAAAGTAAAYSVHVIRQGTSSEAGHA